MNKNTNTLFKNDKMLSEYSIQLEKIKSRASDLLNIYSLLALRSLNTIKGNQDIK